MKFYILLILLIHLFILSNAQNKTDDNTAVFKEVKPSIRIKSQEEYDRLMNTTDITYIMFFYKRVHKESQDVASHLVKIAAKLEYLSSIIMVDCASKYGQTLEICIDVFEKPADYPKIKILVPPEYRFNPYTKKINNHIESLWPKGTPMTEENIYTYMTVNIISRSTKLQAENLDMFTR